MFSCQDPLDFKLCNLMIIYMLIMKCDDLVIQFCNNYSSDFYISELFKSLVPYSGKLSRGKLFAFFAASEPSVKVLSAKFCGHTHIIIGQSFLSETLVLYRNAKVFSLESFLLYVLL